MAYYNLTFNVIGPTLAKTPLLAYINQELEAMKWTGLDGILVVSDCVLFAEGLGCRTAGSPLLGTPRLC